MLQRMRDGAQTIGAKILVGIIVLVLTVFGFGAFNLFAVGEPVAATVNGQDITEAALGVEMERRRREILRQMGEQADPSLIDDGLLRASTLSLLIDRSLLRQMAGDLGLAASAARLNRDILANPDFQVVGAFDEDLFRAVLANAGLSPASYQDELALNTLVVQGAEGLGDTGAPTDREVRQAASLFMQRRDVAYLPFRTADFAVDIEVSDEDIAAYYDYNIDRYLTLEAADLEYVVLALDELADGAEVTDEDIRCGIRGGAARSPGAGGCGAAQGRPHPLRSQRCAVRGRSHRVAGGCPVGDRGRGVVRGEGARTVRGYRFRRQRRRPRSRGTRRVRSRLRRSPVGPSTRANCPSRS